MFFSFFLGPLYHSRHSKNSGGSGGSGAYAELSDSLEPWMADDPQDFDPDAFAATHYGDASEKRIRQLAAHLGSLRNQAVGLALFAT